MDKYFYLVAQLPTLFFGEKPALRLTGFIAEAQKWVKGNDWQLLLSIAENGDAPESSAAFRQFRMYEADLRQDIAHWRKARRANHDYKPAHLPATFLKEGNPLEIEQKLIRLQWDFLDSLESGHHFDIDFLVIYALKLKLLERLSLFDKEKGFETYQQRSQTNVEI